MNNRIGISTLPFFLILALVFLWITFPQIKNEIFEEERYSLANFDIEEQVYIPASNNLEDSIYLYNNHYSLYFSLDGGSSFQKATNNVVRLADVKNPEIIYEQTSVRWKHPKGSFPKVKNIVVKIKDVEKEIESKTIVYNFKETINESALPVVYITMPSEDLFGWSKGIWVSGEAGSQDKGFYKSWWYRSANFVKRGSDWSRKCNVQYIANAQEGFKQNCEVRISGNATRHFPQKSMKFFPLAKNNRRDKLDYPIWKEEGFKKSTSFLLRHSGNDNSRTMFADLLMHEMAKESKVVVQDGFPVSVFINGNYWGIYNLRERIDAYFLAKKEKVKSKDITILMCEGLGNEIIRKEGRKKDMHEFEQMINELSSEQTLSDEAYESLKEKISIKSFIDYIFFETFYANKDWLYNNTTWYRAKGKKWKWILNDLDYSLAYPAEDRTKTDMFKLLNDESITGRLFQALISNEGFKEKFKKRATKLVAERFNEKSIEESYFALKSKYDSDIEKQIRRWRFIDNLAKWEEYCKKNLTFLKERSKSYKKQIEEL